MFSLEELMEELEPLNMRRLMEGDEIEKYFKFMEENCHAQGFVKWRAPAKLLPMSNQTEIEGHVFKEFETFMRNDKISEKDLLTKLPCGYVEDLYRIAIGVNPEIFSERTLEELTEHLLEYPYRCLDERYEYPFWSLDAIIKFRPSLIDDRSFSNLVRALGRYMEENRNPFLAAFNEDGIPDPSKYFRNLLGDAKRYTKLLIGHGLDENLLGYLISNGAIDSRVVVEAETHLSGENHENALNFLKTVTEMRPEYAIIGFRDCIEKAYDIYPFAKEVPKESFTALTDNMERYGISSVGVSLAIGDRVLAGKEIEKIKMLDEMIDGHRPEVGYYFASSVLDGRSSIESLQSFISGALEYYSMEDEKLSALENVIVSYIPGISNLSGDGLEMMGYVLSNSKTHMTNFLHLPETERFGALMARMKDISDWIRRPQMREYYTSTHSRIHEEI